MARVTVVAWGSYGDVRGYGPLYRTREEAERSVRRDGHGCHRQGGYSDRDLVAVDADGCCYAVYDGPVDEADWVPGPGGRTSGAARYSDADLAEVWKATRS